MEGSFNDSFSRARPGKIRLVIADDHPVVRFGLRARFERLQDVQVVGMAASGAQVIELVHDLQPDVLLLDLHMPDMSGLQIMQAVRQSHIPVQVLAFSGYVDSNCLQQLAKFNVAGYLTKDEPLDVLVDAIRGAAQGVDGWFSRSVAEVMS